ncbi:hypothetical protein [Pseudomonas putida]
MKLTDLAVLLTGGEAPLIGLNAAPEEAARFAALKFPGKAYCLVEGQCDQRTTSCVVTQTQVAIFIQIEQQSL